MKVAIIGCGSIGLSFAEKLLSKDFDSFKVFGNFDNKYAASKAAGAMLNINSEIDCFNESSDLTKWKLNHRELALSEWKNVAKRLYESGYTKKNLLFGKGTQIILKNNTNEIESSSYESMYRATFKQEIPKNSDSFLIEDEQSVDSIAYLKSVFGLVSKKQLHIKDNVEKISKKDGSYTITTQAKEIYSGFTHVFIMAGSWSNQILNQSNKFSVSVNRNSYKGVGSALKVKSELSYVEQPYFDRIVRTPNRGGTCGIHSVQRESELYVGASSVITNIELKSPRLSSVDALIQGCREVLELDPYQLSCDVVTGYRPVIDDGIPVIGEIDQNIFCLFGTKRDGFTWAPAFASLIYDYYFNNKMSDSLDKLLKITNPGRELTSCGNAKDCIEAYARNKIFESYQHGIKLKDSEVENLYRIATSTHEAIEVKYRKSIGLQPELINMLHYVEGYGLNG